MPGVLGVFTAADLGLEPVPAAFNPMVARTLLASDKVRYVGEPVVAVVAETYEQAVDAARPCSSTIDLLDALVDVEAGARQLHPDLRVRRLQRRVRHHRCSACPTTPATSSSPAARSWSGPLREPARRARARSRCAARPPRGTATGSSSGSPPSTPRARSSRSRRSTASTRPGPGDHPRRRRRLRRQDRAYPEELLLGRLAKEVGRPVRFRETAASRWWRSATAAPRCSTSPSAVAATAR
jgi:hypothetical protein